MSEEGKLCIESLADVSAVGNTFTRPLSRSSSGLRFRAGAGHAGVVEDLSITDCVSVRLKRIPTRGPIPLGTVSDQPRTSETTVRVSLQDVADRAGVSAATASRSLRGLAKVSPDTRQRVIEAARELSYTTSLQSSEFAPGPRKTVA